MGATGPLIHHVGVDDGVRGPQDQADEEADAQGLLDFIGFGKWDVVLIDLFCRTNSIFETSI